MKFIHDGIEFEIDDISSRTEKEYIEDFEKYVRNLVKVEKKGKIKINWSDYVKTYYFKNESFNTLENFRRNEALEAMNILSVHSEGNWEVVAEIITVIFPEESKFLWKFHDDVVNAWVILNPLIHFSKSSTTIYYFTNREDAICFGDAINKFHSLEWCVRQIGKEIEHRLATREAYIINNPRYPEKHPESKKKLKI